MSLPNTATTDFARAERLRKLARREPDIRALVEELETLRARVAEAEAAAAAEGKPKAK